MGGRADLRTARGRPLHLLRRQVPAAVGPGRPRRRTRPHPRSALEAQLLRLRAAQADQGGAPGWPRCRARSGGPPDALPGHSRGQPVEEALHHQVRPRPRPRPGPRQSQLQCQPSRRAVGVRLHVLLDVVGHRLRRLRHRRLLPAPRRLEGGPFDDHDARPRRAQHGGVVTSALRSCRRHVSLRCGVARRIQLVVATPRDGGGVRWFVDSKQQTVRSVRG